MYIREKAVIKLVSMLLRLLDGEYRIKLIIGLLRMLGMKIGKTRDFLRFEEE